MLWARADKLKKYSILIFRSLSNQFHIQYSDDVVFLSRFPSYPQLDGDWPILRINKWSAIVAADKNEVKAVCYLA